VIGATEDLAVGTEVEVAGRRVAIVRRAGTAERPIVRLEGVADRDAAGGLRGERLLVEAGEPEEGEYLAEELVGCEVPGIGTVRRIVNAPSCDLLEVGDEAVLVPLIADAIRRLDLDARVIEVDLRFLGLGEGRA
jgi:16S rRNA processing protein RimM